MNTVNNNARTQQHRDIMRQAGRRQAQIWVPDTRHTNFVAECRRQCRLAAKADAADRALLHLLDDAPVEVDGWTS